MLDGIAPPHLLNLAASLIEPSPKDDKLTTLSNPDPPSQPSSSTPPRTLP